MGTTAVCATLCCWLAAAWAVHLSWATPPVDSSHNYNNLLPRRDRRQSCGFKCQSGSCVAADQKCDGQADCPDSSDETQATCSNFPCPDYALRCAYGGCVNGDARCNGRYECADGSDEKGCPETGKKCKVGEFMCQSGACVDTTLQCDGRKDCDDGSDETRELCNNLPCNSYAFRCNYGGCIDGNGKCNGVAQCADGSDEEPRVCGSPGTTSTTSTTSTRRPPDTDSSLVCDPETVISTIGTPPNTECGLRRVKRNAGGIPFIINGDDAEPGEFPWHVAVLERKLGIMSNICGGTLVSPRLVISAAHCFWASGKVKEKELFQIAAGTIDLSLDPPDADEQRQGISAIKINCFYSDFEKFYDEDIAAVILQQEFTLTKRVYPICIDWEEIYRPTLGVVAGWGLNEEYETPQKLQKVWLSSVDINICRENVPSNFSNYIANRKFCAGYKNGTGVCNGDSGGGLVFRDSERSKWYLWGIVSVGITDKSRGTIKLCSKKDYALFTNIYKFLPWLQSVYT